MRKLILYGVIIFQIAMIISLIRGIQLSERSVQRIDQMEEAKIKLQKENKQLIAEGEYVKSPYYLEKVAREELHLSKLGETVVIIPGENITSEPDQVVQGLNNDKPNWYKWWEVLSGGN